MSHFQTLIRLICIPFLCTYYIIEAVIKFCVPNRFLKVKNIKPNDIVLITGAGMGLGQQTAIHFVKNGCRQLIIWDINLTAANETKDMIQSLGCKVWTFKVDVTDRDTVMKTAQEIKSTIGTVTYLVNNAGIVAGKSILELQPDHVKKVMDVNVVSHFWTIQAFLPDMLRVGGHIVTVSSIVGQLPAPYLAEYVASKFASYGLHAALRAELKQVTNGDKVATTVVCPWAIRTGMFDGVDTGDVLPELEPPVVAEAIVQAVLANRESLILPSSIRFLPIMSHVLPEKVMDLTYSLLTNVDTGKNLVGREKCE